MLACLPVSDYVRFPSRTQMNTGLQKWETTQKMRSANYPTPAELDAYANKVANSPLSIQIFPNSVKVPQKKHIRRTVNGLDTSSSTQRHTPYPSQVSAGGGLLAVLRLPAKSLLRDSDGSRGPRQVYKATMNPHGASYAAQSTLNLPQTHMESLTQSAAQKQGGLHPQPLQQGVNHPMTLHHRNTNHSHSLQRQQSLQQVQTLPQHRPPHPQTLQRQQSLPPLPQTLQQHQQVPLCSQQRLSHLQTLKHPAPPPPALLSQPVASQDPHLISDAVPHAGLQHGQSLLPPQVATPTSAGLQQPPYGPRKLPDADAPPNVTVSTSTIPLSMAASLHQNRTGDLSSIVHQINQLCQARAGGGATSVCEGQIANPSPISRNLLINASSRVSSHHPVLPATAASSCLMAGANEKALPLTPHALPAFTSEPEKVQLRQQQQQQQHHHHHHLHHNQKQLHHHHPQSQIQRSWAQHQLSHLQQPPEGAHPCKNPRIEPPADCSLPPGNLSYPLNIPNAAAVQGFTPLKHPVDKPRPPSPVSCPVASLPYINGHYMQPPWSAVPTATGSRPQEHSVAFQASTDRVLGAKYRPGKDDGGQNKLLHNVDFLDFQVPGFHEHQNIEALEKMHRTGVMSHIQEPRDHGGVPTHHPGYC